MHVLFCCCLPVVPKEDSSIADQHMQGDVPANKLLGKGLDTAERGKVKVHEFNIGSRLEME